jgi:hypothetical protein
VKYFGSLACDFDADTGEEQSWAIAVTPDGSQVYVAYNHGINVLKSNVRCPAEHRHAHRHRGRFRAAV